MMRYSDSKTRHEYYFNAGLTAAAVHAMFHHSVEDRAASIEMAMAHGAHLARIEMQEMSAARANANLFAEIVADVDASYGIPMPGDEVTK